MKTKLILGKSLNDFMFKSIGNSLLSSIHYLVGDSVDNLVWDSVGRPLLIKTQLNIRLWKQR